MKTVLSFVVLVSLSACAQIPAQKIDAAQVVQGGAPLRSAQGAFVTGRDWNNQPSEARNAGKDDGK